MMNANLSCPASTENSNEARAWKVTKDFREQWCLTQAPKTRWGTPKPKGQGDWFGKEQV